MECACYFTIPTINQYRHKVETPYNCECDSVIGLRQQYSCLNKTSSETTTMEFEILDKPIHFHLHGNWSTVENHLMSSRGFTPLRFT